ncbi:MAG: hypothetical protein CML68_23880 [Rhodobacteraceae bacterium]|nr:hypothetical protein [Paracoccaceae bacterium]
MLQAILAVVAMSPQARLSRTKLMDLLWPSSGAKEARTSLRVALSKLRAEFRHSAPDLLDIDDRVVGLAPDAFERDIDADDPGRRAGEELLEGLDVSLRDSEGFETWLRDERSAWAERTAPQKTQALPPLPKLRSPVGQGVPSPLDPPRGPLLPPTELWSVEPRVRLTLGQLPVATSSEAGRVFGQVVLNQVCDAAAHSGVAIPVDRPEDRADIRLEAVVAELGGTWQVEIRLNRRDSLRATLVSEARLPSDLKQAMNSPGMQQIIDQAVDALIRQKPIGVDLGMQGLVDEISAMYLAGQSQRLELRANLAAAEGTLPRKSTVIRSFLETFILGENVDDGEPSEDQLALALRAAEAVYEGGNLNPVELSLTGYGLDFIAADRSRAFNLMHEAVHAGPEVALAWDNLAITYFRHGDFERARLAAQNALKFGYDSPLIGIFETTYCMTCLATGDAAAADYYGRRALRRNGTYLSAQCHTAAAVALNGQVETAEDMVRQMLDTRPDLTLALIEERFMARFPQQAQEALLRGLRLAGLK